MAQVAVAATGKRAAVPVGIPSVVSVATQQGLRSCWAVAETRWEGVEILSTGEDFHPSSDERCRSAAHPDSISQVPHLPQETFDMAVQLRLTRIGKKKQPQYRIVAADSRSPRDGRFIEILGHYDPRQEPSGLRVDNDKAVKWLSQGAQPTERVAKLLEISGAMEQFKASK